MLFSNKIIRSFVDLPDFMSLIIHSVGCNLHCYKCFNYEPLVERPADTCQPEELLKKIQHVSSLSDAIIISGGEFLSNKTEDIIHFIQQLKLFYHGLVIINTNGCFPDKMKLIGKLVDGFHTDMKLPFYYVDIDIDRDVMQMVLGKIVDPNIILESIEYTIQADKGYSQIRSVNYELFDDNTFVENKKYIDSLNQKYRKNTPYYVNKLLKNT
jgi:pyruvate-formate lyase-activating enzyme